MIVSASITMILLSLAALIGLWADHLHAVAKESVGGTRIDRFESQAAMLESLAIVVFCCGMGVVLWELSSPFVEWMNNTPDTRATSNPYYKQLNNPPGAGP